MGGLGVYKYLQIFLVLVDVVELEDVWVLDELQDGDLPLHLGGRGAVAIAMVTEKWRSERPLSPSHPVPKQPPSPETHTPSSAPIPTASPGSRS